MFKRCILALIVSLAPVAALADDYPTHPVKLIVPFTPGSSTDAIGREVAQFLGKSMNQAFIVENRPGAQATIGAAEVARAKPDGYTLLLGTTTSQSAAPNLFKKLPYDAAKDFAPIGRIGAVVFVLVVRADLPVHSVNELIEYGRKSTAKPLAWGYANSANQVAVSALVRHGGFNATAVPYKGVPQVVVDMLGGSIDFTIADLTNMVPQIKSGKLRALAVTSEKEVAALPGVPPLGQTMKGFQLVGWYGLFAPAKTPEPVLEALAQRLQQGLADPEVQKRIENNGLIPFPAGREELRKFVASETSKWAELVKGAGIEPE
jgi:tripartite-type tricarboxylate transporter receptor subunit TctC